MTNNSVFEKIKVTILAVIMISIPLGKLFAYILTLSNIINDPFIINHVCVLWFAIPVLLITYILDICFKKSKFNYIDILTIILIFLAFLSTIFAVVTKISIFGMTKRNEGLLSILSYYLIFLNAKNIKKIESKKFLIDIFLYIGLFQVLYSILQIYTNFGIVRRFSIPYLAHGLCANPNFFASYMSMLVIFSSTLYIKNKNIKYLILGAIYNISLTLAQTSGVFLSVIICLIFIMIYFHKKEYIKRTLIVSLTLLIVFFITNFSSLYVQQKIFKNNIDPQYNIIKELEYTSSKLTNEKVDESVIRSLGNGRINIWMNLLPKVKNYWLVGAGLDNVAYIYPQWDSVNIDKAHNVYLQILITNGLPALIIYCGLLLIIFIKGFKLKNDDVAIYMLFVVYSIQAFANISVIDVAPYFYLFLGLLTSNFTKKLNKKN